MDYFNSIICQLNFNDNRIFENDLFVLKLTTNKNLPFGCIVYGHISDVDTNTYPIIMYDKRFSQSKRNGIFLYSYL